MDAYNVIFTGRIAPGANREQVEENLLRLLKCPAERIAPFFTGTALVVKKNLPRERAETFSEALTRAGAVCAIRKTGPVKATADSPARPADRPVKVVSPVIRGAQLLFAPLTCPVLTAADGGIDVNRKDSAFVPFEDIALLAVTYDSGQGASVLRLLMFIHPMKRPLIVDAAKISFADFPNVSGENLLSSTRQFVAFLLEKNPDIVIDEDTRALRDGGRPLEMGRDVVALATALAPEVPKREGAQALAGPKPNPAASRPAMDPAPPLSPQPVRPEEKPIPMPASPQSTADAVDKNPDAGQGADDGGDEKAPEPRRRWVRAILYAFLGTIFFFCMLSSIVKLDDLNKAIRDEGKVFGKKAPAGYEYRFTSPELQRQYELLKINRRQARRASFLGVFLGLFLFVFFFRKAYRNWQGYG